MYCHFELSTLSSVVESSPEERLDVETVVFCELELEVLELELDEQAVSNIAEHNKIAELVKNHFFLGIKFSLFKKFVLNFS